MNTEESVIIPKAILQSYIFKKSTYLKIFLFCLAKIEAYDTALIVDGKTYPVPKGSFVTSYRAIANSCSEGKRPLVLDTVRRVLNFLMAEHLIVHQTTVDFTHIHVQKPTRYFIQSYTKSYTDRTHFDPSLQQNQGMAVHPLTTANQKFKPVVKNVKNKREITPEKLKEIAYYYKVDTDYVERVHEKILNYEQSKYGREYYIDMNRTIRLWIISDIEKGKVKQGEVIGSF